MVFADKTSLFAQLYQVAEQFIMILSNVMQWLFFEPFTPLQTWYWGAYSAIAGSPFEDFFSPVYRYLAWAAGAPKVTGDEISFGAFILTGGIAIWVFVRVVIFVFDLIVKLISVIRSWINIDVFPM